jgi:hypothetical protein
MANKFDRFVLSNSVNAIGANLKSTKNKREIEGLSASSALSGLTSVNLASPAIAPGIPSASAMSLVARAVEKAATDLQETTIYNTYVSVFDTIQSIAQSGNYYYELTLNQQQKAELTPLLTKYGYSVELVNNRKHNTVIRWGSASTVVPVAVPITRSVGSSGI